MKNHVAPSIEPVESQAARDVSHQPALDEVVRGCQESDRASQHSLYDAFREDVFRIVFRMVGASDAPDLLQQTFVQAFKSIDQFAKQSHVRTWLYRVAVNECLQFLRRGKRRTVLPLDIEPMDLSPGHETALESKELLEIALSKLEPDLRAAFVLREVEQMPYSQIASALQIQEGTVASRLNAARRKLQAILIELGWEP